jgi:hypothetical protein
MTGTELLQRKVQMAKKTLKKCSISATMKEMQTKTTLRYLLTPVRMATIKNTSINFLINNIFKVIEWIGGYIVLGKLKIT